MTPPEELTIDNYLDELLPEEWEMAKDYADSYPQDADAKGAAEFIGMEAVISTADRLLEDVPFNEYIDFKALTPIQ